MIDQIRLPFDINLQSLSRSASKKRLNIILSLIAYDLYTNTIAQYYSAQVSLLMKFSRNICNTQWIYYFE